MAKTKTKNDHAAAQKTSFNTACNYNGTEKKSGEDVAARDERGSTTATMEALNEIDALFATKKGQVKEAGKQALSAEMKRQEDRDHNARISKRSKLSGDRKDVAQLGEGEWANDGRGGIYNNDGFTGRRDEGGHRVFKAHLFNREGFGNTKACPFDCDCCYI